MKIKTRFFLLVELGNEIHLPFKVLRRSALVPLMAVMYKKEIVQAISICGEIGCGLGP